MRRTCSVYGSADTKYLKEQQGDRAKRNAIGVYERSGLSQYVGKAEAVGYGTGVHFPTDWEPRYAMAAGVCAAPDRRENYTVHRSGPRVPAIAVGGEYFANPDDALDGFVVNGTLPVREADGVHSLTDVPVYAMGPCQDSFGGTYNNVDIFFKMATCLGLARPDPRRCAPRPGPGPKADKATARGRGRQEGALVMSLRIVYSPSPPPPPLSLSHHGLPMTGQSAHGPRQAP